MSHTLHCDFVVRSPRGPIYWWPLIFESMWRHSFQFSHPGLPKGTGYYFSMDDPGPTEQKIPHETKSGLVPFNIVWDEIYTGGRNVIVSFWLQESDPFPLDVQVYQGNDQKIINIHFTFEGAEVMGLSNQEAKERLRIVFEVAKTLYQTCHPSSGEMYWLYSGYRSASLASFGMGPEKSSLGHSSLEAQEKKLVTQVLPNGSTVYLFEPVLIPKRGGGWDFISLFDEEKR